MRTDSQALGAAGPVVLEGLPRAGLAYVLAAEPAGGVELVVAADDERAFELAQDLAALAPRREVLHFPGEPHVPYEEVSPDPAAVAQRLYVRQRLLAGAKPVVVASAAALVMRWMPEEVFAAAFVRVRAGAEVDREALARSLVRAGYQRTNLVEDEGTFALRGGIIDVYPPGRARPLRVDLFGDEVASIKGFDPQTQRTFEAEPELVVHPIREVVFDDAAVARAEDWLRAYGDEVEVPTRRLSALVEEIHTRNYFFGIEALWPIFYAAPAPVFATLLGGEATVVLDEPQAVFAAMQKTLERAAAERERAIERHLVGVPVALHYAPVEEVIAALEARLRLSAVTLADDRAEAVTAHGLRAPVDLCRELEARRKSPALGEVLDPLVADLKARRERGQGVLYACRTRGSAERLRELLLGRKQDLPLLGDAVEVFDARRRISAAIAVLPLSSGLCDEERRLCIVTDGEIFGRPASTKKKRRHPEGGEGVTSLKDLREGDHVVHVDHGVGRYLGLSRLILNGVDGDYVHLEYAGGDKLYLPVYRLGLLQRYRGETASAKLDKLGGTRWEKAKQRVRDAVMALAHALLAMQARRRALPGFALPAPDDHYQAFAQSFPFDETPDQARAITEVLGDLQKSSPMDRLVCGDVGFGKTEVALRGVFMAIMAKKQVAVLVPTTVLAEQHGMTFAERLGPFGVSVEVLSRFRSAAESSEILQRAREGKLDVLIGTHRLLSSDVAFKDLGLLVVDEEHRFGVKHKERIKQLRSHVHALTLTATPIPRTMHMAMVGLRDLSLIQTPPTARTAIKTEVTRFDEEVIAEALRRELFRGGQVFVVHNRIRSIGAMAELVRRLVPEARVAVAHGEMAGPELEKIMVDFIHREVNVLCCTAIIESGIDIPSANTMIVNRADMFGLAQLHQLRGRIGRGRERAYAHLLLPRSDKLTPQAAERLSVLKRFSDLGSGFQIASHDLDLRGAGDLLGHDQSGHIAAVGFELYTQLLAEAVEQVKGQKHAHAVEPEIKLPVPAVLPESYVAQPMERLAYYQRLSQAPSDEAVFDVIAEIRDLYGEAPDEVEHLGEVMVIRRRLMALGAVALSGDFTDELLRLGVGFLPEAPVDRSQLAQKLQSEPERYRLLPSGRLAITAKLPKGASPRTCLRLVREELGRLPTHRGIPGL